MAGTGLIAVTNTTPEPPPEALHLDAGERAAIAFAMKQRDALVLLDERRARHTAKELGLSVRETLGILVEAKRRGLVRDVGSLLQKMQ